MKTLKDAQREKFQAECKQEAKNDALVKGIVAAYREDCTIGYDEGMRQLMKMGYDEVAADDLLVPIIE